MIGGRIHSSAIEKNLSIGSYLKINLNVGPGASTRKRNCQCRLVLLASRRNHEKQQEHEEDIEHRGDLESKFTILGMTCHNLERKLQFQRFNPQSKLNLWQNNFPAVRMTP